MGTDTALDAARNIPGFLKKTNYVEPVDNVNSNFADRFGGKDLFAYCAENPGAGKSFIDLMQGLARHKLTWVDVYDSSSLFQGVEIKADKPMLCDVGGGHGLDIERFRAKHANDIPSKSLYLQDVPNVIEMAKLHPDIEGKVYDFFEPQTLPGEPTKDVQ